MQFIHKFLHALYTTTIQLSVKELSTGLSTRS